MTLQLVDVSKAFGGLPVLDRVSIDVPAGSRLAVVGASGSGKSTLLRIIAGFERPDAGSVVLHGRVVAGADVNIPAHRRGVGYVAQDGALFPHLTVARNIGFGLRRHPDRARRVLEVMELASLDTALAGRFPHQLSGGQQQRVALARALALEPEVILLDEPFSSLDTRLRAHTRQVMVEVLERSGVTTVLVTHDQEEALLFGQQIGVIADGRLVQSGPPSAVFDAPLDAEIAEFLGDVVMVPAQAIDGARAVCAFGCLPVRHDYSGGAGRVRAMVRPSQLRIDAEDAGDATVIEMRQAGSAAELRLRLGGAEMTTEVTHRVPLHEAWRYRLGSAVSVSVDGGVVLYPDARVGSLAFDSDASTVGAVDEATVTT